jgi:PKD repeat protein
VEICKEIDLSDSCLLLQSAFTAEVNAQSRTVSFTNQSSGDFSYQLWGFGDGNTSTNQNPVHTYENAGIYNVCLVLRDEALGCSDYHCFEIEVGSVATVDPSRDNNWVLFPNPSRSGEPFFLQKRASANDQVKQINIVDAMGQTIYSERLNISFSSTLITLNDNAKLSPGTYYIRMIQENSIEVYKLIIQ